MEVKAGHEMKHLFLLYEALGSAIIMIAINWSPYISHYKFRLLGSTSALFSSLVSFGLGDAVCHFNSAVSLAVLVHEGVDKPNLIYLI